MRINCVSGLKFNSLDSAKKQEYEKKRRYLITEHRTITDNSLEIIGGAMLADFGYSVAKERFFPLFAGIGLAITTLFNLPSYIKEYKEIDKLNNEYKSEELKNKNGFDKFLFNWLSLKEGEVNDKTVKKYKQNLQNTGIGIASGIVAGGLFALYANSNKKIDKTFSCLFGTITGAAVTIIKNLLDNRKENQSLSE